MDSKPVIVVGNGWGAVSIVASLLKKEKSVIWIEGTGARLDFPLPSLEDRSGAEFFKQICGLYDISVGDVEEGTFLREFKNSGFYPPKWSTFSEPSKAEDVRRESLWDPELRIVGLKDSRYVKRLSEIDQILRSKLDHYVESGKLMKVSQIPLVDIHSDPAQGTVEVKLASGDQYVGSKVYYADRLSDLPSYKTLFPHLEVRSGDHVNRFKFSELQKKWSPVGILQVAFRHFMPLKQIVNEGIFCKLTREQNDQFDRYVWGYFSEDGSESFWNIFLKAEEAESNHEIAKKIRRIKQVLNKVFSGSEWLPDGKKDFSSTIEGEKVRFEDAMIFSKGNPPSEPIVTSDEQVYLITDGFGPSSSLQQVGLLSANLGATP